MKHFSTVMFVSLLAFYLMYLAYNSIMEPDALELTHEARMIVQDIKAGRVQYQYVRFGGPTGIRCLVVRLRNEQPIGISCDWRDETIKP